MGGALRGRARATARVALHLRRRLSASARRVHYPALRDQHTLQSSLSMVYDREMGNMRTLLVSPLPRWFLLTSKLVASTAVSLLQVYTYLVIAWFWDIQPPPIGYLTVLPALILSGLMLGALGMLISSLVKQLENFAGVMNFVIFPMFFASSALYPLWRGEEGSPGVYYFFLF